MSSWALLCAAALAAPPRFVVDPLTRTFRDGLNHSRLFRGVNFVQKEHPFYPTVDAAVLADLQDVGANVVRLGVMLPGVFPWANQTANGTYLDEIVRIVRLLHGAGVWTIVDLHQDVLAPALCGEGTPEWMLNVSELHARPFPEPLTLKPKQGCAPAGALKAIGWSEFYMTDACGKAFQQVYDGTGLMAAMFAKYWTAVPQRLAGEPGVLAYELLNEPWVGDHVGRPSLLLGQRAERETVGPFMARMHALVRAQDPRTPVLFAPAELNNRAMRSVGYDRGFLPGEPMAFHAYCVVGTDGPGPTTPVAKGLCHVNDRKQVETRAADLARLGTAGIVTEFGGVEDVATGLAEVRFVTEQLDRASPPLSWAFWAWVPPQDDYRREVARSYPRSVPGTLETLSFDAGTGALTVGFAPLPAGGTADIMLAKRLHYPDGYTVQCVPACTAVDSPTGANVTVPPGVPRMTITVQRKAQILV